MSALSKLLEIVRQELSGRLALDNAAAITRFDRAVGSSGYQKATRTLQEKLLGFGLSEVNIEPFPIDGKICYGTWTPPPAWEPRGAELWVLEPDQEKMADFAIEPMSLVVNSAPTPPDGVTAELVDVGKGESESDYQDKDVKGKIVLATGSAGDVQRLAIKERGALGLILNSMAGWSLDPAIKRSPTDLPDAIPLTRLEVEDPDQATPFAFSISHRQMQKLRTMLQNGRVKVKAVVDADLGPGQMENLSATIKGAVYPDEEMLIIAHLCHAKPGANDNASGAALGVEIMRTLLTLVQEERVPQPQLSIRLLLVPEIYGTIAHFTSHAEQANKVVAAINLDMVGADPELTKAYCHMINTPWSCPTFLNDLGQYLLGIVAAEGKLHQGTARIQNWLYAPSPFVGGSDHYILTDGSFRVSTVFFFCWPDRFYHTNLDTVDKLSPEQMARIGSIAGTMALAIASLDRDMALSLVNLVETGARRRMTQRASEIINQALTGQALGPQEEAEGEKETLAQSLATFEVQGQIEKGALRSVAPLLHGPEDRQAVEKIVAARLDQLEKGQRAEEERIKAFLAAKDFPWPDLSVPAGDKDAGKIPEKLFLGPLDSRYLYRRRPELRDKYKQKQKDDPDYGLKQIEALNFVDGKRSLGQISRLVSAEYGPFPVAELHEYFSDLEQADLLTFEKNHPASLKNTTSV
ncbi:MAG: DUF4910 domain-containing protein [Anaerolineae bacterium]